MFFYDIARKLLRGVGLDKRADRLRYLCGRRYRARLRLPGLSEIAEFYGVSGSYIFKPSQYKLSKSLGKF